MSSWRRVMVSGQGSTLTDAQGRPYLDAMAGLWCVNVGYGRPEIAEALRAQALKLPYYHSFSSMATDTPALLAERLIGKGDMLVLDAGSSVARRIQGAWVTEDEVRKVASVWKRQAPDVRFDDSVQGSDDGPGGSTSGSGGGSGGGDDDDMLWQAMELVVRSQLGSTSMLQRRLIYTAITRGRRLVVVVGSKKALAIAVGQATSRRRWSKLAEWLSGPPAAAAGGAWKHHGGAPEDAPNRKPSYSDRAQQQRETPGCKSPDRLFRHRNGNQ